MSDPSAVILLAAGASTRLGRPKQLVPFRGTTLLRHAAGTALAARVGPVVVVIGHEAARMREELADLSLTIAEHAGWADGLGSSLAAGVAAVERDHGGVRALLVMTCDQPLVGPATLRALVEAALAGGRIAACAYGGAVGVPAAFTRRYFPELVRSTGDKGAKRLLLTHAASVTSLPCPEAELDIDVATDLPKLT